MTVQTARRGRTRRFTFTTVYADLRGRGAYGQAKLRNEFQPQNRPGCLDSPRQTDRRWNHSESKRPNGLSDMTNDDTLRVVTCAYVPSIISTPDFYQNG